MNRKRWLLAGVVVIGGAAAWFGLEWYVRAKLGEAPQSRALRVEPERRGRQPAATAPWVPATQDVAWATPLGGAGALPVEDQVKLLDQVVQANRANRERLTTWRGDIQIVEESAKQGKPYPPTTREVTFVYSHEFGAMRIVMRLQGGSGGYTGRSPAPDGSEKFIGNRMTRYGALFCLDDVVVGRPRPKVRTLRVLGLPDRQYERVGIWMEHFFDPMNCFGTDHDTAGGMLWMFPEMLRQPRRVAQTVGRDKDRVMVDLSIGSSINRYFERRR